MTEHSALAVAPARLRLLGGWQLLVGGEDVHLGHREQRLVALLGLGGLSARARVASTLWPDSTDERALASLRRAVLQVQRRRPGLLVAGRLTLALDAAVQVDTDDLRRAVGLTGLPMTDPVAHELLTALRGGELLPGWYDDWVVEERTLLQQERVGALERVALHGLDHDDLVLALEACRSAGAIDPLRESVREIAIRAHAGLGDTSGALAEYRRYASVVRDELGVGPSSRIQALVEPLLVPAAPTPDVTVPRPPPLPAPAAARPADPVPPDEPWVPPPMTLDAFLDAGRPHRPRNGVRRAGAALVGAALVVAVAVATTTTGSERDRGPTTDPGAIPRLQDPPPERDPAPERTVRVRALEPAAGAAAFAVHATRPPVQVRLVVRGPAGLRVVRHLVVRGPDGRQVVVEGLDPGTYAWSVTSGSASPVQGEVSVPVRATRRPEPGARVTPGVTQAVSTAPSPTSSPTSTPTSTPTATPSATPTATPTATPSPSPTPRPTGTPTDPGTVAPPPVG
jgi:DNA-binding SARP family transcriptional activator